MVLQLKTVIDCLLEAGGCRGKRCGVIYCGVKGQLWELSG